MFVVEGDKITLTRGDSFLATVEIKNADGSEYVLQEGDKVAFYLKRDLMNTARSRYADAQPLITKDISTLVLKLEPDDTKGLSFGEYVYDVEITFANGDVDTFINNAPFVLVPEVG